MRFLPLYSSAATAKSIKSCVYNFLNAHSRIFHRLVSVDSDGPTFREFNLFSVQGRRTSWVAIDFRLPKALSSRAHGNRQMLPEKFFSKGILFKYNATTASISVYLYTLFKTKTKRIASNLQSNVR